MNFNISNQEGTSKLSDVGGRDKTRDGDRD